MQELRFGYFPQRFTYKEASYHVTVIIRAWEQRIQNTRRLHFRVRCYLDQEGTDSEDMELFHDLTSDEWHIQLNETNEVTP
jgi:hypothetical protein